MLGFFIGLLIGGLVGVAVMAMLHAASREDDRMQDYDAEYEL